jgi:hypothetical protein
LGEVGSKNVYVTFETGPSVVTYKYEVQERKHKTYFCLLNYIHTADKECVKSILTNVFKGSPIFNLLIQLIQPRLNYL